MAIKDDLPDGLYVPRLLCNPDLVLDAAYKGTSNGTNIFLSTANQGRNQTWRLAWNTDGTAYLICLLNGKCADVANGKMGQGENVQCWDYKAQRYQKWNIEKGSTTKKVGDKTLQSYILKCASDTNYCMESNAEPSTVVSGTNVCIAKYTGATDQEWLFDTCEKITDGGVYEVRTMTNKSNCLDNTNGVVSNGNTPMSFARNNTIAQKWVLIKDGTDWKIRQGATNSVLDAGTGDLPTSEWATVQLWSDNSSRNQRWTLETVSTVVIDGDDTAVVRIKPTKNANMALDVMYGSSTSGTGVKLHVLNDDSDSQLWSLVPTTLVDPTMPVPNISGWVSDLSKTATTTTAYHSTKTIYLQGTCPQSWTTKNGNSFRIRWRSRNFSVNGTWGSWSSYCSWRTPLMKLQGNKWWFTQNFSQSSMDYKKVIRTQYQFELCTQGINEYRNITSEITTKTLNFVFHPEPKITSATLSPEGLLCTYSVNYELPIKFFLSSIKDGTQQVLKKAYTAVGDDDNNTFTIPFDYLKSIPKEHDKLTFTYLVGTDDFAKFPTPTYSQTVSLDYHDGTVDKHLVLKDANVAGAQMKYYFADANDEVCLLMSDGQLYPLTKYGSYWLVPKFMEDVTLIGKWESSDGTQWATCADIIKANTVAFHGFTWGEEDGVVVWLNKDEILKEERNFSTSSEEHTLLGRAHPYVSYLANQRSQNNFTKVSATVNGYIVPDRLEDYGTTPASVERMMEVGHCLYRSPKGRISTVAVTDTSLTFERDIIQIEISYVEESL